MLFRSVWLATTKSGRMLDDDASVADEEGVLNLTIEDGETRVFDRNDLDPVYMVKHVSTQSDGSETVMVIYNGRVKTYKGVRKITAKSSKDVLLQTSSSRDRVINSTIYVGDGVTSEIDFEGGSGNDEYYVSGGSSMKMNVINAEAGNDVVKIGATNPAIGFDIFGGDGVNFLEGGPGDDHIHGGSGTNFKIGRAHV